jgi:amidohydrolase
VVVGAGCDIGHDFVRHPAPRVISFTGSTPVGRRDQDPATAAPNHNPNFFVNEAALVVGVRAMSSMALTHLTSPGMTSTGEQR